jgi:hypothetical protein
MATRSGLPWLLDEYVVVGEMWVRRGRSVGASDAEVKDLAAVLGRSPAAISRRVGNFAGTDRPGSGLKPITGEALELWTRLRSDRALLAETVEHARLRLNLLSGVTESSVEGAWHARVVPAETPSVEPTEVLASKQGRVEIQKEALLREKFRAWRDRSGGCLRGIEIDTLNSKLRVDLYDPSVNVLIEVKAHASRDLLRLAVGQLFDYRRYLKFPVRLAVLVPARPDEDLMGLLSAANVGAIWPHETSFRDSTGGHLLHSAPVDV